MISFQKIEDCSKEQKQQVEEIFFESSAKKSFKDEEEKKNFHYNYLGYYLVHHPELCLVAIKEDQVMAYIVGSLDSNKDEELIQKLPHYGLFKNLFSKYPTHLHINAHAQSRGLGIGSLLIFEFEQVAVAHGSIGVHLITSPSAQNVKFYQNNKYLFSENREFLNNNLLLLGKKLGS